MKEIVKVFLIFIVAVIFTVSCLRYLDDRKEEQAREKRLDSMKVNINYYPPFKVKKHGK